MEVAASSPFVLFLVLRGESKHKVQILGRKTQPWASLKDGYIRDKGPRKSGLFRGKKKVLVGILRPEFPSFRGLLEHISHSRAESTCSVYSPRGLASH